MGSKNGLVALWDHSQSQESGIPWVSVLCRPPSVLPSAGHGPSCLPRRRAQFSLSFPGSEVEVGNSEHLVWRWRQEFQGFGDSHGTW